MLFVLTLLFISLSTFITALPMDRHAATASMEKIANSRWAMDPRYHGCWTPVPVTVSERRSFNLTSFEP